MFGVLVVVLCPDCVADLGFGAGERQIPLVVSSRVLRAYRFRAGGTRCPPLRTWQQMTRLVGIGEHSYVVLAILHGALLSSGG